MHEIDFSRVIGRLDEVDELGHAFDVDRFERFDFAFEQLSRLEIDLPSQCLDGDMLTRQFVVRLIRLARSPCADELDIRVALSKRIGCRLNHALHSLLDVEYLVGADGNLAAK